MTERHETVLLHESVEGLNIAPGDIVVDATFGAGGHFSELAQALAGAGTLVGIDADRQSFAREEERIRKAKETGIAVHLVHDNFRNMNDILDSLELAQVDKVLFDLGWNAYQLSQGRGFSFRAEEPLLMTYGEPQTQTTARDLVNSLTEEELADLIFSYGEERFSRGIARAVVAARKKEKIETTGQLVECVLEGTPAWYHHRKIHPATKTFQALRIAANDELGALREGLSACLTRLSPCGRVAVITFHSIEDRIVKSAFKDAAHEGVGNIITKKPLTAGNEELSRNPRARSAKLRIFERAAAGRASVVFSPATLQEYA